MKPTFTIKLNQPILPGLVATGKFDGKTPSIACVTTGGKIILHSPHESIGADGQLNSLRYLNLNRKITSIAAGKVVRDDVASNAPDLLFVGTQSNLLAYDVERNADAFFAEVQDGVNKLVIGKFSGGMPMAISGGNCSILGFDGKGAEAFWTVTGDNVSAMCLYDMDNNNFATPYLLVGSDDFEIRLFRNEEMVAEVTEADKVVVLHNIPLSNGRFAYALANGTLGVYANLKTRLWRVKTKHQATSILAYDIDLDGVAEIFSGWNNGAYNIRRQENGEVLFRGHLGAGIASILKIDYRMDGKEEAVIVSEAGEMVAYLPTDIDFGAMVDSGIGKEDAADQQIIDTLHAQKIAYSNELKQLQRVGKLSKTADVPVGALPPNTSLTYLVYPDLELRSIVLRVEVNADVQIVNLIAVDQESVVMADREVLALSPKTINKVATLPLQPSRNVACTIRLQTHLSSRSQNSQLVVHETDLKIPKFGAFANIEDLTQYPVPVGSVTFFTLDSIDRIVEYISQAFILPRKIQIIADKFKIGFIAVCHTNSSVLGLTNSRVNTKTDGDMIVFSLQRPDANASGGQNRMSRVKIYCDNMDLAGEALQDMAKYLKWTELESEAMFQDEFQAFEEVTKTVSECNTARTNLSADMAEESQRIKALVIRAEDSRLMSDMFTMRKAYTELMGVNNALMGAYALRAQNHETLLGALKEVNQMIQKAANLRLGNNKSRVIAECRNAVKNNNMESLFRILRYGYEPSKAMAPGKK